MNFFSILNFVAALLISALSGMGVGGGGLFVIYLAWVSDTPQLAAQGMNLLFFLCSAGASMLIHLRQRRIFWYPVALLIAGGVIGVLLGTELSIHVDEGMLRKIFGGMLVVSGILALKRKEQEGSK